jgi:drug/metabolite transporter (DMT)-like permease
MAMFLTLCLIWGSTWIGVKAALEAVPPLFLAGSRFTCAGMILTLFAVLRSGWTVKRTDLARLLIASFLMITLCYGALFWGMRFVDSGTAAVLDLGLTPIALLTFALILRDEELALQKVMAIALGLVGCLILFGPDLQRVWHSEADSAARLAGSAAIAGSTVAYGLGSVMARPLLKRYPALLLSGTTTLCGGLILLLCSFGTEATFGEALQGRWGWNAWAGWIFLVLFGSLIGYSLYMILLRDVGSSRAGMYAFVSPVVALLLGAWLRDELLSATSIAGAGVMLMGAFIALKQPSAAAPT